MQHFFTWHLNKTFINFSVIHKPLWSTLEIVSQNCWYVKYCKLSWLLESENSALTSDPDKTGFYSTTKKLLRDLTIDTMCNKLDHQWHQNDQYWSFLWNGSSKIQIFTDIWYLFCWRLLRPTYSIFLKTGWWNSNGKTPWTHHQP